EQLLREYFADIIEKDVRRHVAVRSPLTLQRLYQMIFSSVGSETSLRKLGRALDIATDTVGQYVDAGQSAYLIMACPFFTYSEKKQLSRNRKFYAIDMGLRRAVTTKGGDDLGKSF